MEILRSLDLVAVIRDAAASGKPLMGICLGMQLLMSESCEFGTHPGLGIVEGRVSRLADALAKGEKLKTPHMGWSRVCVPGLPHGARVEAWNGTPLETLRNGTFMYFVHSYFPEPAGAAVLSRTRYGSVEFCSAFRKGNIFGCQFHPERSGPYGLAVYEAFAAAVRPAAGRSL
jgi:glutamine amidotransferase